MFHPEHAVDLRQVPAQSPGEFSLADVTRTHRSIELNLCTLECRQFDRVSGRLRRCRQVAAVLHERVKNGQQRIRRTLQCFVAYFPKRHRFRDVRKRDGELSVVRCDRDWIPHASPLLQAERFLDRVDRASRQVFLLAMHREIRDRCAMAREMF
jgi:hypothetical protein